MQKNRIIKPKIRWKAKKSPDVWQGQHQTLEVQQALNLTAYTAKQPFGGIFICWQPKPPALYTGQAAYIFCALDHTVSNCPDKCPSNEGFLRSVSRDPEGGD